MSRPRTRSQGPLETEIIDGSEGSQHIITQRRLSKELQVRLETLRFYPTQSREEREASVSSHQQTVTMAKRPASVILRPPSTIPLASRPSSALGIQPLREVSTKFSQHHVVPMHNSTAEDGKQGHTMNLVTPQTEDINVTDMEVAEIVEAVTPLTDTSDQFTDKNNITMTKNPGITGEQHNCNTPPANIFRTVNIEDQWLRRYILDGKNSQICDIVENTLFLVPLTPVSNRWGPLHNGKVSANQRLSYHQAWDGLSQSETFPPLSPVRSNVITPKSYKKRCVCTLGSVLKFHS